MTLIAAISSTQAPYLHASLTPSARRSGSLPANDGCHATTHPNVHDSTKSFLLSTAHSPRAPHTQPVCTSSACIERLILQPVNINFLKPFQPARTAEDRSSLLWLGSAVDLMRLLGEWRKRGRKVKAWQAFSPCIGSELHTRGKASKRARRLSSSAGAQPDLYVCT